MNISTRRPFGLLSALAVLFVLAETPAAHAFDPCCNVTGIDKKTGQVTARENATGKTFTFLATNAKALGSFKVGQPIYVNFAAKQASVDGFAPCCNIVSAAAPPH